MADTEDSREKARARTRNWMRKWRAENREEYNAKMRAWRAANPERARELAAKGHQKWVEVNPEKAKEILLQSGRRWRERNPARHAYAVHKIRARRRNIAFLLTFEEWLAIWRDSGKWERRGNGMDSYCMARFRDLGPYAVGNVRICTHRENLAETRELRRGIPVSAETRRRISNARKRAAQGTKSL